ncbi:MAG: S41 family peptidase [Oligoflexia bacterium]|nr:S41 family peptidase [Oligoflexia bacterium]
MKHTIASFAAVAVACALGLAGGSSVVNSAWAQGRNPYQALDTLARAMTVIDAYHIVAVPPDRLIHAAIRGMADSLDRHTVYLSPDEWQALQERNEGRWFGIGIELYPQPEGVRISSVVEGGPAALAGVHSGDILVSVDGQTLDGLDFKDVAEIMIGETGTPVRLGLLRGQDTLEISVVRDQVIAPVVHAELLAPGQGYVRIDHFRQRTAAELVSALGKLEEEGHRPLDGLILDLRGNPGGLLEEAVATIDLFVDHGLIVETRNRQGDQVEAHSAQIGSSLLKEDIDARLVVLIDGGSASASEIVAGALQDLGRAEIVGSPSYGKGSVQQIYEFEDGSALKLTVARYYLASGRTFDTGKGVIPDLLVPREDDLLIARRQIEDALASLPPDQATGLKTDLELIVAHSPADPMESPVPRAGTISERLALDPQLRTAWQQLRDAP